MSAIPLQPLYLLLGGFFAMVAWRAARNRGASGRYSRSAFFGLLAILFVAGDWLPGVVAGALVLLVALIAGFGLPQQAVAPAAPIAAPNPTVRLLLPVIGVPILTIVLSLIALRVKVDGELLFSSQTAPLYALAIACALSLLLALRITRDRPQAALARGGDLLETIGWAAFLPLLLAVLGTLFAQAGVGVALANLIGAWLPLEMRVVAVLAYGLGMALLTMAMGNAFAAFPVIAGGIGLPYLVSMHGADPAPLVAIGMLCGYCGTLMTPMAANFNLVPVALLELSDRHAVIRAQIPTAVPLLAANLLLLGLLCF